MTVGCFRLFASKPFALAIAACSVRIAGAIDDIVEDNHPPEVRIHFAKDATFEEWVYNNDPTHKRRIDEAIEMSCKQMVEEIRTRFSLPDATLPKLKIAAQGDVHKYHVERENLRQRFAATLVNADPSGLHSAKSEWAIVREQATAFRTRHQSLFDQRSLTWKVAAKLAADEKLKIRQRSIDLLIHELEVTIGRDLSNRKDVAKALSDQFHLTKVHKDFDRQLVGFLCWQLPDEVFRTLFDETTIAPARQTFASYQQYDYLLESHQLIPATTQAGSTKLRNRYQRRQLPANADEPDNLSRAVNGTRH